MAVNWTTEQATAMAPDPGAVTTGRQLAARSQWLTLGRADLAVWGTFQGSGRDPYQVCADFAAPRPAYKCTCPSHKRPCKHVLGMAFLLAGDPAAFTETEPPPWAAEWFHSRIRQPAQPPRPSAPKKPVDTEAQAKRAAEREAKVKAGLEELELWLRDLVRNGLAAPRPSDFWAGMAARMVDAQAPGPARRLREMIPIPNSGPDWPERLLERLGQLYLLIESYKRLDTFPPPLQAEIRSHIGWTQEKDELLARPGVRDVWVTVGRRMEEIETNLRAQYTWLWGRESGEAALLLDFAYGTRPFETQFVPGFRVDAELVFYDGAHPTRAVVKRLHAAPRSLAPDEALPGYPTVAAALEAYAAALARTPWLDRFPLSLRAVTPVRYSNTWVLRDREGARLHLVSRFEGKWHLVALSGGHPFDLFGEWDGERLLPMGVWAEGRFVTF